MRIVCWQTILMKYHTLFLSKIRKDVAKFVVFGALKVKNEEGKLSLEFMPWKLSENPGFPWIPMDCQE